MPQSKEPFRDPSEPLFEQRINELETGTGIGEVTSAKIGAEAVTGAKLATATLGRRTLMTCNGVLTAAKATGTYFFLPTGAEMVVSGTEYTTGFPMMLIKVSDYEIAGRTPKFNTNIYGLVNAKAPGSSFVAGWYQIEKSEGATGKNKIVYKAVTAGSTATIAAPAAETTPSKSSAGFAPAEGFFALGVEVATEALKAESQVALTATLTLTYT